MQQSVKLWPRHRWFDPIPAHFTSPWRSWIAHVVPDHEVARSNRAGDATTDVSLVVGGGLQNRP
jgi:hypothetical protein